MKIAEDDQVMSQPTEVTNVPGYVPIGYVPSNNVYSGFTPKKGKEYWLIAVPSSLKEQEWDIDTINVQLDKNPAASLKQTHRKDDRPSSKCLLETVQSVSENERFLYAKEGHHGRQVVLSPPFSRKFMLRLIDGSSPKSEELGTQEEGASPFVELKAPTQPRGLGVGNFGFPGISAHSLKVGERSSVPNAVRKGGEHEKEKAKKHSKSTKVKKERSH